LGSISKQGLIPFTRYTLPKGLKNYTYEGLQQVKTEIFEGIRFQNKLKQKIILHEIIINHFSFKCVSLLTFQNFQCVYLKSLA